MKRIYILVGVLALALLAIPACKKAPDQQSVNREMQQATPGHQSRTLGQIAENPTKQPEPLKWPGEITNLEEVFQDDENMYARSFLVVFDVSGSMRGNKLEDGKTALKRFVEHLKSSDYIGLVPFSSENHVALSLGRSDKVNQDFLSQVEQLRADGGTELVRAMKTAYTELTRQGQRQLGYGEYTMVIVTDGRSANNPLPYVRFLIEETPIQVYTIGFHIGSDHALNLHGQTNYVEANNLDELTEGLKGALAESVDMFQ